MVSFYFSFGNPFCSWFCLGTTFYFRSIFHNIIVQAIASTRDLHYPSAPQSPYVRIKLRTITILLSLIQPLARLWGRLKHGLTPWRKCSQKFKGFSMKYRANLWSESWLSSEQWLQSLESEIKKQGAVVRRGNDFEAWDLDIQGGLFSSVRVLMAIEEHEGGKQFAKFRGIQRFSSFGIILAIVFTGLCIWALIVNQWIAGGFLGFLSIIFISWMILEGAYVGKSLQVAFENLKSIK